MRRSAGTWTWPLALIGGLLACNGASPHPAEPVGPDLTMGAVRQILSTKWCDRGPRTGHLAWDPVAGATGYEVDLVATDTCCDNDYASWPEERWRAGRRVTVTGTSTDDATIDSTYYRARAVTSDGGAGPWTHGIWECWVD